MEGLFSIRQIIEPTLAIFEPTLEILLCNWVIFHCCKWPTIGQIIEASGHTDNDGDQQQQPRYVQRTTNTFNNLFAVKLFLRDVIVQAWCVAKKGIKGRDTASLRFQGSNT